ncbi:hypothetical protein E2C01_083585 [Portunus trituberculatus]|uniref:Uncharacterized protein n=1 Tax=Portunus trituberculatus TaxID=210409 RepID=A0A5B7J5A0_PORTR|nr:hypothetical protein [Portunus trituberculatus]
MPISQTFQPLSFCSSIPCPVFLTPSFASIDKSFLNNSQYSSRHQASHTNGDGNENEEDDKNSDKKRRSDIFFSFRIRKALAKDMKKSS